MIGIQKQFISKVGEPGYTVNMVNYMLNHLGLDSISLYSENKIRRYCKENGLFLSLDDLKIVPQGWGSNTRGLIPKSDLQKIIDGLKIPVTFDTLGTAANELDYEW